MLMYSEIFSIIPLTTHISIRDVHKELTKNKIFFKLTKIINLLFLKRYSPNKHIKFICYNPHTGEEELLVKKMG